ncbi:MAG: hypothetical protein JWO31_3379, partial [Phycisphaerales bacterium]|nr:hypothetical protein [Phycisphaerales bacterium]
AAAAAHGLKLQSVLVGSRRAALVNNVLVQEGGEVDGFTVEKISPGAVVVRSGVYRFELRMDQ